MQIHSEKKIERRWVKAKKRRPTAIRDLWLRLVRSHPRFCETDEPEKRCHWVRGNTPVSVFASRNRRTRDRRHAADGRCAWRQRRSRNNVTIALPRRRTIRIGCCVAPD